MSDIKFYYDGKYLGSGDPDYLDYEGGVYDLLKSDKKAAQQILDYLNSLGDPVFPVSDDDWQTPETDVTKVDITELYNEFMTELNYEYDEFDDHLYTVFGDFEIFTEDDEEFDESYKRESINYDKGATDFVNWMYSKYPGATFVSERTFTKNGENFVNLIFDLSNMDSKFETPYDEIFFDDEVFDRSVNVAAWGKNDSMLVVTCYDDEDWDNLEEGCGSKRRKKKIVNQGCGSKRSAKKEAYYDGLDDRFAFDLDDEFEIYVGNKLVPCKVVDSKVFNDGEGLTYTIVTAIDGDDAHWQMDDWVQRGLDEFFREETDGSSYAYGLWETTDELYNNGDYPENGENTRWYVTDVDVYPVISDWDDEYDESYERESKEDRYVIGKDFNTKDWWIYDNDTNRNICYFDTEEEAQEYLANLEEACGGKKKKKATKENLLTFKDKNASFDTSITIDMWYGDEFEPKKYGADSYYGPDGYHGWIYSDSGKKIGDYVADDSVIIDKYFLIDWGE